MHTFVRRTEEYLTKRVTHSCVFCGAELLKDRKVLCLHIARHGLKNLGEYKKQIIGQRQRKRMGEANPSSHRSLLKNFNLSTQTQKVDDICRRRLDDVLRRDLPLTTTPLDAKEDLSRDEPNEGNEIAPGLGGNAGNQALQSLNESGTRTSSTAPLADESSPSFRCKLCSLRRLSWNGMKEHLSSVHHSTDFSRLIALDDISHSDREEQGPEMPSESEETPGKATAQKLEASPIGDVAPAVKRIKTIPRSAATKSTSPSRLHSETSSSASNSKVNTEETDATSPSGRYISSFVIMEATVHVSEIDFIA